MKEFPIKFPRTYHLPWSEGASNDDHMLSYDQFENHFFETEYVLTEKIDGQNIVFHNGEVYCRSPNSSFTRHPSINYAKTYCARLPHFSGRLFFENVSYVHSIEYPKLPTKMFLIGGTDIHLADNNRGPGIDTETVWSIDRTIEFAKEYDLVHVPIIHKAKTDVLTLFYNLMGKRIPIHTEGYVIRSSNSFDINQYRYNVAKFVRSNHVTTDEHWLETAKKATNIQCSLTDFESKWNSLRQFLQKVN